MESPSAFRSARAIFSPAAQPTANISRNPRRAFCITNVISQGKGSRRKGIARFTASAQEAPPKGGPISHISKTARRGAPGSREFHDCLFVDRQLPVICHRSRRTQPQSLPGQCALRAVKSQWRGRKAFRRVLASPPFQLGAESLSLRARSSNG